PRRRGRARLAAPRSPISVSPGWFIPSPARGMATRALLCGSWRLTRGLVQPPLAHRDEHRIADQAEQDVRVLQCLAIRRQRLDVARLGSGGLCHTLTALSQASMLLQVPAAVIGFLAADIPGVLDVAVFGRVFEVIDAVLARAVDDGILRAMLMRFGLGAVAMDRVFDRGLCRDPAGERGDGGEQDDRLRRPREPVLS